MTFETGNPYRARSGTTPNPKGRPLSDKSEIKALKREIASLKARVRRGPEPKTEADFVRWHSVRNEPMPLDEQHLQVAYWEDFDPEIADFLTRNA